MKTVEQRMADLLTGVAAALKGPPAPLTAHDWSDLPAVAAALAGRGPLYVAMVHDRHYEPTPHLFTDKDRAIEFAKEKIGKLAGDGDFEELPLYGDNLYAATYEPGDHSVWVHPATIDADA